MSRAFQPLVVCYHAVSDGWQHHLSVRPETLERQLRDLLRRGFRPASASGTVAGRGRLLHVTFDDAYRSVLSALPILERLGIPATVFACPAYADHGRPLDVPELAAEVAAQPHELATMTWEGLREIAERGVEVGSHTMSHPHLPELSDAELGRELGDSRAYIESELGRPCRFVAYPYGDDDSRVHAAARAAGYRGAFALPGRRSPFDPFALPRVALYRHDGRGRATLKTLVAARRLAAPLRGVLPRP